MRYWLKELRKERNMTMAEVAKKAGISQSYYRDIENGRRGYEVPVRTATAIAEVLGFPWEKFFSSTKDERMGIC